MDDGVIIAKYDYEARQPLELTIRKNDRLKIIDSSQNWWKVSNERSEVGFVPSNFLRRESILDRAKDTLLGFTKQNSITDKKASRVGNHPIANTSISMSYATAKFAYNPQREDELRLAKGDHITVLDKSSDGWWRGELNSAVGWFPSNYVDETNEPPPFANVSSTLDGIQEDFSAPEQHERAELKDTNRILEIVVAIYSFDAQNSEELSFKKNEKLDILEHPAHDPDWFKARNVRGEVGLVPTNYIEIIDHNPSQSAFANGHSLNQPTLTGPYANQPWYFGFISREQSDYELNARGERGDFLVRDSESNPGDYSISLKGYDRNKHFWVQVDTGNGIYKIGNRTFSSMQSLIQHYMKSPIFSNDSTGERLYLTKPLPRS